MDAHLSIICNADALTPQELDACARVACGVALRYAADRLSPERIDWCAQRAPWQAVRYAAAHLSAGRLRWCADLHPGTALIYAAELLGWDESLPDHAVRARNVIECNWIPIDWSDRDPNSELREFA